MGQYPQRSEWLVLSISTSEGFLARAPTLISVLVYSFGPICRPIRFHCTVQKRLLIWLLFSLRFVLFNVKNGQLFCILLVL